MRFEQSIDIDASQQRVWEVLADIEGWPRRIDTVERVEALTQGSLGKGSRFRLRQPKLPEAVWEVTTWDPPANFEWTSKSPGATSVAGHRVDALGDGRARLTLTVEMQGLLVPIFGRFYKDLTHDYMAREAAGMQRAAEAGG